MIIAFRPEWREVTVNGVKHMNVATNIMLQLLEACRTLRQQGYARSEFFQSGVAFEITGR